MKINPILNTDSYKYSHYLQYPPGTTHVCSYIEPRHSGTIQEKFAMKMREEPVFEKVVFFGLQMFLKEYMSMPITMEDIDEAEAIVKAHGEPFNRVDFELIVKEHRGFWPVSIQALPEGTVHNTSIPQVQIINTDDRLPWVTCFIETALLRAIWYPTTVATISWHGKQIIKKYLEETADGLDGLPFKLHDFGARGASSNETAGIGGVAHLVNFMGSDTVQALVYARRYYNEPSAAFSIPAAEHSTITSWGKENERDAYANMLKQFSFPGKLVAVVSDSYDIYNAVEKIWGEQLKNEVMTSGGTLVIRPDSGDPTRVPLELMNILGDKFGYTWTGKGYKLLPSYLRIIQGDGVNLHSIKKCLENLKQGGWSAENIAFGMGGELLQKCNRDTLSYACKANAVKVNGRWIDVFKQPVGDVLKQSKRGVQAVVERQNGTKWLEVKRDDEILMTDINLLQEVWYNGIQQRFQSLTDIRKRVDQPY